MEVVVPKAHTSPDFNFSYPYASAPSSPKPFGNLDEYYYCYTSAPTSPARAAAVYSYLEREMDDWEDQKPLTPKFGNEFDFSLGLEEQLQELSTADKLFDKGRIRPLKPPPPPPPPPAKGSSSPRGGRERGREGTPLSHAAASSRSRREFRSLSPLREGEGVFQKTPVFSPSTSTPVSTAPPLTKSSGSRKWRLKDLLLFRSASEGRATGRGSKDPLRKYTLLPSSFNKRRTAGDQDTKSNGSSRSLDSYSSMKRGSGTPVSAHELHYTANRAASEEQKKKTPLPFHRNSFFGCLHFNPAVRSITRGFNSYSFNRGGS